MPSRICSSFSIIAKSPRISRRKDKKKSKSFNFAPSNLICLPPLQLSPRLARSLRYPFVGSHNRAQLSVHCRERVTTGSWGSVRRVSWGRDGGKETVQSCYTRTNPWFDFLKAISFLVDSLGINY